MTTANMGLTLPDVSVTPGPTWASQINSDLTLIDQHNHTAGFGARIPTDGLLINAELKFNQTTPNGIPVTGLSRVGLLSPQTPPVATGVYSDASGDLYYDNAAGIPVQITVGNSIAGATGSITGMTPESSASFDGGTGAFIWQKDAGASEAATMDSGPLRVRDGTAGANAITITPPVGLAAAYTFTLPGSAPSGQRLMTANTGVSSFASVDGTLTLTPSLLKVASLGITAAQLGTNAVETAKIKDEAVTQQKTQIKPVQYSSNIVSVSTTSTTPVDATGLSCLFVALANRPICVELTPWGDGTVGSIYSSASYADVSIYAIAPGGSSLPIATIRAPTAVGVQLSTLRQIIISPIAGLYSFQVKFNTGGSGTVTIGHARLIAYPL